MPTPTTRIEIMLLDNHPFSNRLLDMELLELLDPMTCNSNSNIKASNHRRRIWEGLLA